MGSYESLENSFALIQKVIWSCTDFRIPYDEHIREYYRFIIDVYCQDWASGLLAKPQTGRRLLPPSINARMVALEARLRWWLLTRPGMVFSEYASFPQFPNPHVRTNGFLIERRRMLGFDPQDIREKLDACAFESGPNGLTTQLRRAGLSAIVVGRDGGGWDVDEWPRSRTFRLQDQANLLISDNQSRKFA